MEYPYYKNYSDDEKIKQDFQKLIKLKSTLVRPRKNCKIQISYQTDHLSKLTDYFTEECRVKCSFRKNLPPIEKYQQVKQLVPKTNDYWKIEDFLYNHVRGCNNFDVKIVLQILRYFKPEKMLDFSSGWGDRLIGAIAYGCHYQGVDPSKCLHPKYKKIISTLVSKDKRKNYSVAKSGFENYKIKEDEYDLVFTSPPFFDLEIYEDSKNQSINKFSTLEKWKNNFLFPAMEKSVKCLKEKGSLAIYIQNYTSESGKRIEYVQDMKNKIKDLGMSYQGNICFSNFSDLERPRIIYVWKKV